MSRVRGDESAALEVERAVAERYSAAALRREEALCCPVDYDAGLLEAIPEEVLERDYGCGDPSRYVRPGDTVLDLGSGSGKIAFIASQVTGAQGRIVGVDANPEMLALARRAASVVAARVGYANAEFRRGRIQDLGLDLDLLDAWLAAHPLRSAAELGAFEEACDRLRREAPLVPDASVDLVVSNCVLNLVRPAAKAQLLREIRRVLRPGGRIAISDIVSDGPVPQQLRDDPELWSGCVSGAFEEQALLRDLEAVGLREVSVDSRAPTPFRVIDGLQFTSVTVVGALPDAEGRLGGAAGGCCGA